MGRTDKRQGKIVLPEVDENHHHICVEVAAIIASYIWLHYIAISYIARARAEMYRE